MAGNEAKTAVEETKKPKGSGKFVSISDELQVDHRQCLRKGHMIFKGKFQGEEVAVKRVDFSEQYATEVEAILKLTKHPNIVKYKGYAEWESAEMPGLAYLYIVMELCDKNSLYELSGDQAFFHSHRVNALMQAMIGLSQIHNNGMIHGDLRATNVLRSLDGRNFKVADFGLSKKQRGTKTRIGAYGWTAPDKDLTPKYDIYSAGVMIYQVLSEGNPSVIDLDGLVCPDSSIASDLIKNMLENDPNDRPTASEALRHPLFWNDDKRISFYCDFSKCVLGMPGEGAQNMIDSINKDIGHDSIKGWMELLTSNEIDLVTEPKWFVEDVLHLGASTVVVDSSSAFNLIINIANGHLKQKTPEEIDSKAESTQELWRCVANKFPEFFTKLYRFTKKQLQRCSKQEAAGTEWDAVRCYFEGNNRGGLEPNWTESRKFRFLCRLASEEDVAEFYEDNGAGVFGDNWMEKLELSKSDKKPIQERLIERGSKIKIEKWAMFNRAVGGKGLEEMNYKPNSLLSLLKFMNDISTRFEENGNQLKAILGDDSSNVWGFFSRRFPQLFTVVHTGVSCSSSYDSLLVDL